MNPLLVALLLLLIALVGAQLTFGQRQVPLGPRIFITIGLPFVFLGFAFGPHVADLLSRDTVDQLTPLLALGLGWIGVLFGLQLDREHLRKFPLRYLGLALLQAAIAFVIVFVLGRLAIGVWSSLSLDAVILAAAATASVSTPAAIALISNTYMARGKVSQLLFYAASVDGAVGIVALGLIQAGYHPGPRSGGLALSVLEWFAISTLLGFFFGVLFLSLTRLRAPSQEFMLFLMGLVLFAAGTAFYLSLSPLYVCMTAGIVIANFSPMRRRAYAALSEWEQPIYIIVLVLAGALLQFDSWLIIPLVVAYVAGRLIAKWLGGYLASRLAPQGFPVPGSFGLALAPQGGISLAMAISFILIYHPPVPALVLPVHLFFATVVIAVGMTDLMGPFLIRGILERAGELRADAQ